MRQVETIKCTHVVVRVSLGFYDAEDNLVREEVFPQSGGIPGLTTLFHPHPEQLANLIELCREQAWAKLAAEAAESAAEPAEGSGAG